MMVSSKIFICDRNNFPKKLQQSVPIICIDDLPLYKYFMRSHKLSRSFNSLVLNNHNELLQPMHLSLLKLSDKSLFESARIVEILLEHKDKKIILRTQHNELVQLIIQSIYPDFKNIEYVAANKKKERSFFRHVLYSFVLLVNSFFVRRYNNKNVFVMHNDKISFEFFKPYQNICLAYPMYTKSINIKPLNYELNKYLNKKFITWKYFKQGFFNYFSNKKRIKNSNLPLVLKKLYCRDLIRLEVNSSIIISLKDKFPALENVFGIFDTNSIIDYATFHLNKENIKTVCIPHGVNFKYKVNYISYGVNTYTFWSKNHMDRMEESNLVNNENTQKIITGNIIYKKMLSNADKNINLDVNGSEYRKILVIGEYFSNDDFYGSPFNKEASKLLFDTLEEFYKTNCDVKITIRTRLDDGYYELAKTYCSENIAISSPKKSIIDEMNSHDLIISVFSNALHEGLLLKKKVLQVNLLEIENYRDLAKDELVYYADSVEKLNVILYDWYNNKLPLLDYQKHLELYANNGEFRVINSEVLNDSY